MQATGCLTDNLFGSRISYSRSLISCSRPNYERGQTASGASWLQNSLPKSATTSNLRLPRVQRPWPDATCVLSADPHPLY
jgi:hypothetical protein